MTVGPSVGVLSPHIAHRKCLRLAECECWWYQGGKRMKAQDVVDVANRVGTALVKWVPMERVLTLVQGESPHGVYPVTPADLEE